MIDVNLWGVIHGVHVFLPLLLANEGGGHFVNTASMGGLVVAPRLGSYNVSKYGVVALSEALALELEQDGSKVGVSILCPGPTRTNLETSSRNRPATLADGGLADVSLGNSGMFAHLHWVAPEEAGELVVEAIERGDLYVITHPEQIGRIEARFDAILGAFRSAAARQPQG